MFYVYKPLSEKNEQKYIEEKQKLEHTIGKVTKRLSYLKRRHKVLSEYLKELNTEGMDF